MHELTLNIKGHALTAAMETAMMASGFKLINMEGFFFWMGTWWFVKEGGLRGGLGCTGSS